MNSFKSITLAFLIMIAAATVISACSSSGGNAASVIPKHPSPSPSPAILNLYVANISRESVDQYVPQFSVTSSPAVSFATGQADNGVASDGAYVVTSPDTSTINVYAQLINDTESPEATFTNPSTIEKLQFEDRKSTRLN